MSSYPLFKFLFLFIIGILYGFYLNELNTDYLFSFIALITFSFFIERLIKNHLKWKNKAIGFIDNSWNDTNSLDIALFLEDLILKNNKINLPSINKIVVRKNNYGLSLIRNEKINKSSIHNISKMGAYIHEL